MKMRLAVSALAMLLAMPAAWAQSGARERAAPAKVGVINVQVAITSTAEGKQAAAELQSKFAPRQSGTRQHAQAMDDLQTRLRTGQTTLSDDEKARLAREGDVLNAHLPAQAAGSAGRFQRRAAGCGEPHRPQDDGDSGQVLEGQRLRRYPRHFRPADARGLCGAIRST